MRIALDFSPYRVGSWSRRRNRAFFVDERRVFRYLRSYLGNSWVRNVSVTSVTVTVMTTTMVSAMVVVHKQLRLKTRSTQRDMRLWLLVFEHVVCLDPAKFGRGSLRRQDARIEGFGRGNRALCLSRWELLTPSIDFIHPSAV